jgi:hypothetical protein
MRKIININNYLLDCFMGAAEIAAAAAVAGAGTAI